MLTYGQLSDKCITENEYFESVGAMTYRCNVSAINQYGCYFYSNETRITVADFQNSIKPYIQTYASQITKKYVPNLNLYFTGLENFLTYLGTGMYYPSRLYFDTFGLSAASFLIYYTDPISQTSKISNCYFSFSATELTNFTKTDID